MLGWAFSCISSFFFWESKSLAVETLRRASLPPLLSSAILSGENTSLLLDKGVCAGFVVRADIAGMRPDAGPPRRTDYGFLRVANHSLDLLGALRAAVQDSTRSVVLLTANKFEAFQANHGGRGAALSNLRLRDFSDSY